MTHTVLSLLALLGPDVASADFGPFIAPVQGLYPSEEAQCGPHCLYVALKLFGKEPDYRELLRQAATNQRGTSVAGLVEAAKQNGVYALPVELSRRKLCEILMTTDQRLVAICHQKPDHFVVWYRNGNSSFSLVDPKYRYPQHLAQPYDLEDYSGSAILIADEPIRLELSTGHEILLYRIMWAVGLALLFAVGWKVGARFIRSQPLTRLNPVTECNG